MNQQEMDAYDDALADEICKKMWDKAYEELKTPGPLESELIAEAQSLREYLLDCDSRTFGILAVSFMEDALKRIFSQEWRIATSSEIDRYFGSNGPLSTLSQRVSVATAIGWMTDADERQTSLLRKIRNEFAHNHTVRNLQDKPISNYAEALDHIEKAWIDERLPDFGEAYSKASRDHVLRLRIFCHSMQITGRLLARVRFINANLPEGYRPASGFKSLTGAEKGFIRHSSRYCFHSLGVKVV